MMRCEYILLFTIYLSGRFVLNDAEFMEGYVNLIDDDGFSFLGHWMFGHNPGNDTKDSWHLDKFKAGTLDITLKLHKALEFDTRFELALYDDQASSWPLLLANKSNGCKYRDSIYGIDKSMPREWSIIKFLSDSDGNDTWTASINIHEHIVPRWWWAYLVKCDFDMTPAGDFVRNDIYYKLHWTQYNVYSWNREISLHEEFQNVFHCITPWLTLILFIFQCISCYLYYTGNGKGSVHLFIKLLTLCLFLEFISSIFCMFYWFHLTFSGWKEFGILTFSFLFSISCNILFGYLLITAFGFGLRMSITKLNRKLNYVLIFICIFIEIFNFIIYVYTQSTVKEESTLYRYRSHPQVVYGVVMLMIGCIFYVILLFASCRDSLNGIITSIQRNVRIIIGFILMWTWFIWPIVAVGAAKTIPNSRIDFACDVISWTMKMLSISIVIAITHPANPYYDRVFDFAKHFVHARYVKNTPQIVFDDDIDDDDDDDDDNQVQMNEIKKPTVFSTKFNEKKKKKNEKKKLFQIPQDSDEDDDDDDDDYDESDDDLSDNNNKVSVNAVSINDARNEENQTFNEKEN